MAELRSSDVLSKQIPHKHIMANIPWNNGSGGGGSGYTSEVWLRSDTSDQYKKIYNLLQHSHNLIVMFQPDISKKLIFQSTVITKNNADIIVYFIDDDSEILKLTIRSFYTTLFPNNYVEYNKTDGKTAHIEVLSFL